MVSLYDTFAMFPSAHHHHHHHHHPAMGMPPSPSHPILSRHSHPGATQLNLHQHHQGMNPQAAYFGYTTHPHHYGQGAPQYGTNMMGNVEFHQQQFGGLVGGPDASTWYPGLAGVSPRTSGGAVGYEDWANSPNNVLSAHNPASSSGSTNAPGGVVSSPDSSPFQQHGSASPVDIPYPTAAAYGKLLVASGNGEFAAPHHHLQLQSGQDIVSITPIPHNRVRSCSNLTGSAGGPGAGHHTPDSGLAGSDGLSSAGSPGQQQQQQPQQQQQQQQILAAANNNLMNMNNSNNLNEHGTGSGSVGIHHAGMNSLAAGLARPQPNRSPYEWMKKPSYQNSINPIRMTGANSNWITEEDGKTRTKDKYRVVYTDHQRLELEKEFHYSRYITIRRKSELAGLLGLSERQVKIWFQNRRAKERKQVKKREELLHKDKLDVVAPHPHGLHPHAVGPGQMSSVPLTAHPHLSQQQIDTKPVLGLD